jgi:hypothetical protein
MSKQKLEQAEQKDFKEWCGKLDEYYNDLGINAIFFVILFQLSLNIRMAIDSN